MRDAIDERQVGEVEIMAGRNASEAVRQGRWANGIVREYLMVHECGPQGPQRPAQIADDGGQPSRKCASAEEAGGILR